MMTTRLQHAGTIGFIGAGNMAQALIGGLLQQGLSGDRLCASDPYQPTREGLQQQFGVVAEAANSAVAERADALVLAIKPQQMQAVCEEIKALVIARRPLLISVAAGITTELFGGWFGDQQPVVRLMPNTPALVGAGASGLFASAAVSQAQRDTATAIAEAVGIAQWVERETLIDVVTALSGSGPAYFFLIAEALSDAAVAAGLNRATADRLTEQTAFGAAQLLRDSEQDAAALRRQVTSPNGTTEQAIKALERGDLRGLLDTALRAAVTRGQEMAQEVARATRGSA